MGRRRQRRQPLPEPILDVTHCRIAIVGGGLCGLAVALALEQRQQQKQERRFDVDDDDRARNSNITIYERDEKLDERREGYGLTLSYRPGGTLDRLGILDDLADWDCPSRSHYILRGDGRLVGYYGNALTTTESSSSYGQRGNIRVPRQRVRQVLVDRLQRTTICWGHRLVGLEEQPEDQVDDSDDDDHRHNTGRFSKVMKLSFQHGQSVLADLVIAADGIRSDVVRLYWPTLSPVLSRPLGVRIILGLTTSRHNNNKDNDNNDNKTCWPPLLREQGFYTIEPGRRLFVMPYQGSALGHSFDPTEPVRYMWQLSFRVDAVSNNSSTSSLSDTATSTTSTCRSSSTLSSTSPDDLLRQAKDLTAGWHDPVPWLLAHTDRDDIWGTMLHDRDPIFAVTMPTKTTTTTTSEKLSSCHCSRRVIVAGDALHAMSPFKGQGANQSLQDALTIAKWIGGDSDVDNGGTGTTTSKRPFLRYSVAVASCQRELAQRTAPIVQASREAAQFWHSDAAVQATHPWAGVTDPARLVAALATRRRSDNKLLLDFNTTLNLDQAVRDLAREMNLFDMTVQPQPPPPQQLVQEAHAAAKAGCLATLRRLSFECKDAIRFSDCCTIAARAGHLRVVHWLIKEGGCSCPCDFKIKEDEDDDHGDDRISNQMRVLMTRICPSNIIPSK